ncbi:MAG TPA: cytochrome d ubiquinol oxidase subunit II [Polyangia bacterium]
MMLNLIWFVLVAVLVAGYAILDGFDLGVGFLHLLVTRSEDERRVSLASIAPVWDGNEVWLLTAGGALFAAFPPVYATVFSGFYLAMMLVLFALIVRAVSIEARNRGAAPAWRRCFDRSFAVASTLVALLLGVAVGNLMRGLVLNERGEYAGTFLDLLNPFSLFIGATTLAMFAMQGACWLAMKTEGELGKRSITAALFAWAAFVALYIDATLWGPSAVPWLFVRARHSITPWIPLLPMLVCLVSIPILLRQSRVRLAFLCSSIVIACLVAVLAIAACPMFVFCVNDLRLSLTAFNGASSPRTLLTMLIIVVCALPFVLGYTIYIYRVWRGKVRLDDEHY